MLSKILAFQQEEWEKLLGEKLIRRDLEETFLTYLSKPLAKLITGPRRAGKSTFALMLLKDKNFAYVNFDEPQLSKVGLSDLLEAIQEVYGNVNGIFLDEVQNVEGWELLVNSLLRKGFNIVISGSNAKLMSKELSTHLTGRYMSFELLPFSFNEWLRAKGMGVKLTNEGLIRRELVDYMSRGGFPDVVLRGLDESYLETLFNAIVYRDVVLRWRVKHTALLEKLALYLVSSFASEYSYTKLRKLFSFRSVFTVQNYVKYLEESYLFFSLTNFSFKAKERLNSPKKAYVGDLSFINALSPTFSKDIGKRMENVVFLELYRRGHVSGKTLFYYKGRDYEVDFVVKERNKVKQLIQVSYASSLDEIERRELRALLSASEQLKCDNLVVITWDYEGEELLKPWGKAARKRVKFTPLRTRLLNINSED